jgi:hypothetical protein
LPKKLEKKSSLNWKKYSVHFELHFFPVNQTRYFKLENWKNQVQIDRGLGEDQWDYNKPVLLNTFVSQGSAKETGMEERNMCQRRECQKQPADYITSLVL